MSVNKIFFVLVILVSFINLAGYYKDFIEYPPLQKGTISLLDNFNKEFPSLKQVGFSSDLEYIAHILFRIQNSIIPIFIENSPNQDVIFCYSETDFCSKNIENGDWHILKNYANGFYLLSRKDKQ